MTDPPSGLARALGGPAARRRRHRRFVLVAVVLLLIAGAFVVLGGDDDTSDGTDEAVTAFASAPEACDAFEQRLRDEFALSFPDGAPTPEAEAEYLSHAFADTTEELVEVLRSLDPPDASDAIDALDGLVEQLRAEPTIGVGTDPFAATVAPAFDAAGLPECGSGFLGEPG